MISIQEHEQILNGELGKATQGATEKLEDIQSQLEEHYKGAMAEKISEVEQAHKDNLT